MSEIKVNTLTSIDGTVSVDVKDIVNVVVPTQDPHVVNALWNDGGTLKISAG